MTFFSGSALSKEKKTLEWYKKNICFLLKLRQSKFYTLKRVNPVNKLGVFSKFGFFHCIKPKFI